MRSPGFSTDEKANGWRADWRPLAQLLTTEVPAWVVWKGGGDLRGGDLDSAAPSAEWGTVEAVFARWARTAGCAAVIRCDHAMGQRILVGCGRTIGRRLLQLDVVDRKLRCGTPVWFASDLLAVAEVADSVRRLRPGGEGVARLLVDGRDTGAAELVGVDPAGAASLARRLGTRGRMAARPVRRIALDGAVALSALLHPLAIAEAIQRRRSVRTCAVLAALAQERLRPYAAFGEWLAGVELEHEVTWLA